MKRRFGFIIGACLIIGMVDLTTEQVVFAAIYNPLNPTEEIVPTDPPETSKETPETTDDQAEVEKKATTETKQPPDRDITREKIPENKFIPQKKQHEYRVVLADVFSEERFKVDVALLDDDNDGDGEDKPSYLSSLCYLFSGNVLYGQKNEGGVKTRVCDIFE